MAKNSKIYISLLLIALGAGGYYYYKTKSAAPVGPATMAVKVNAAPVLRKDVTLTVDLVGTAVAYETVNVKSRLDSQIMSVSFKDGDNVKEGQVLFTLDDRSIRTEIKQYEANLQKEKAQMENARLQYERAEKLLANGTVSQARIDENKATFESSKAAVNAIQANLDNSRIQLSYATINAPISGRAGTINVTRGNNVKANDTQPLVTINRIQPIRVQFSIPQRYYDQVRDGMSREGGLPVIARRSGGTETTEGGLEYTDNTIDVTNGTFAARARFANEDERLWPGMFVNVTLNLGTEKDALTIPAVAVQGDEGNHFVFVANTADKKALRRPVEIRQMVNDTAIISKGLDSGESVITDGLLRLTDGAAIEIAETPAPAPAPSPAPQP